MKIFNIVMALSLAGVVRLPAQTATANAPAPTPYAIIARDGNSQVWQRTTYEIGPDGKVVPRLHQYTELATGLNHRVNGQWVASEETITILPDGTAAATNGQHQAYFPSDIYNGEIKLVTPDGKVLQSQPVALSYDDGSNTVLIAVLTNSVGQLASSNQVVYPNAFVGINADLCYTYTIAGFEQDVILHEQPPTPASLGLNSATTRLQVLTEFFNPPTPKINIGRLQTVAGKLQNDLLTFGVMQMVQGKAFSMGTNSPSTLVDKQWLQMSGRQFLIEAVPMAAMSNDLQNLPSPINQAQIAPPLLVASRHLTLPTQHLVKATPVPHSKPIQLVEARFQKHGLVLDYQVVNSSLTNFTFQGDTTYYISGITELYGTNIFEGGTVVKYALNTAGIIINSEIKWLTDSYRPAIFTSQDDDTVGETISSSSGIPTQTASTYLDFTTGDSIIPKNIRMLYAGSALVCSNDVCPPFCVRNGQFFDCGSVVVAGNAFPLGLYNVLAEQCESVIVSLDEVDFDAQQVTTYNCSLLLGGYDWCYGTATNCLFVETPFADDASDYFVAFDHSYTLTSDTGVFQTVGGGSAYLATNSPYHNAGTTNIDTALLSSLAGRTTYPPIVYSNVTLSGAVTFSPQAQRDNIGNPDLGYHYDPLDYVFGGCDLYTNLTITAGTAIGWFENYGGVSVGGQPYGVSLDTGAHFIANGTATSPCWAVRFNTVQEGNGNWLNSGWMGGLIFNSVSPLATINARFTKWACPPSQGNLFRDNWCPGVATLTDCETYNVFIGGYALSQYYTNCLFFRSYVSMNNAQYQFPNSYAGSFGADNCTFYNGFLELARFDGQTSYWAVQNTAFDGTGFSWSDNVNGDTNYTQISNNAYNTNNLSGLSYPYGYGAPTNYLETTGPSDVKTGDFNWQSSWFGNFYLPSDSTLIDAGSTTADQVGLYHFTTQTNQTVEGTSPVDIGYHYVATDQYGNPLDSNGDGIPDYLEDANGNGLVDSGEIGWNIGNDLGLQVFITKPRNGSVLP